MLKIYSFLSICLFMLPLATSAQTAQVGFAAKVNGEGIGRARLQASVDATLQRQGTNYGAITDPSRFKALQQQVLDQLIAQELLWQEARRKEIVVTDKELADAVIKVKDQFPSEQDFRTRIQRGGFTEETYTEDLKRQLSVRRMIEQDVAGGITVSDKDVDDFYNANSEKMKQPEEVRS